MEKIRLHVTAQDIKKADEAYKNFESSRASCCPIAQALKRRYKAEVESWAVGRRKAFPAELPWYFSLSAPATLFTRKYDTGLPVKPSRFMLTKHNTLEYVSIFAACFDEDSFEVED